ncbi:MAG TPA: tetratricopeptide repeat protein [Terriglobia bacterium]|nr:tetratricopeptide repeat protein [Terriglobia bacterium]
MRKTAYTLAIVVSLAVFASAPAFGVNKETLQMMQQLDTLQQMMQNLQKTVDSQTAILRTLIEQANDKISTMGSTVEELRKSNEKDNASYNTRLDSMTNQMQELSASLDEAKSRLAKLSDQVTQTQTIIQTLNTPPAATPAGPTSGATLDPNKPTIPDADTLYNSGLSAYNGGQYQLAIQSFQDYLKYYGDTDMASTAQFYIGDCYYNQKNFSQAVEEYNKCLERYPNGNKLPAAQLKKGYALLAMDQKAAGIRELRSLVARYPNAHEAALAAQRLRTLGIIVHVRAH